MSLTPLSLINDINPCRMSLSIAACPWLSCPFSFSSSCSAPALAPYPGASAGPEWSRPGLPPQAAPTSPVAPSVHAASVHGSPMSASSSSTHPQCPQPHRCCSHVQPLRGGGPQCRSLRRSPRSAGGSRRHAHSLAGGDGHPRLQKVRRAEPLVIVAGVLRRSPRWQVQAQQTRSPLR